MFNPKATELSDLRHLRIVTQKELRLLVPYTPQHVLRLEKAGKFPRRIRLGQNRVGWRLIDIESWLAARMPPKTYIDETKIAIQL